MRSRPILAALTVALVVPAFAACIQPDAGDGGGPPAGDDADYPHLVCDPDCNTLATPVNGPLNEVDIAIDPADPDVLVAGGKDYSFGQQDACGTFNVWSGVYSSQDGGRTWHNTFLPGNPGDTTNETGPLSAYNCVSDPVVDFSPDGETAYYLGLSETYGPSGSTADAQNGFVLARSNDDGLTWPHGDVSVVTANQAPAVFNDKEWMAVAPNGDIHVVWAAFLGAGAGGNEVVHAMSTDGGDTWTAPKTLFSSDVETQNTASQGAWPAVTPDGTVHVIWRDFAEPRIRLVTSTDGGETFSQPTTVTTFTPGPSTLDNGSYRTPMNPQLAADGNGTLALVYTDWVGSGNASHYDVEVVTSTDDGDTWSDPVTVNDDGTTTDQFFPAITTGPTGVYHDRFDMIWYDRRDTADTNITVYYAHSTDGVNWSDNVRVSTAAFDGDLGIHQRNFSFIGDYIGVAAGPDLVHAFWADTRTGESEGWTARIDPSAV